MAPTVSPPYHFPQPYRPSQALFLIFTIIIIINNELRFATTYCCAETVRSLPFVYRHFLFHPCYTQQTFRCLLLIQYLQSRFVLDSPCCSYSVALLASTAVVLTFNGSSVIVIFTSVLYTLSPPPTVSTVLSCLTVNLLSTFSPLFFRFTMYTPCHQSFTAPFQSVSRLCLTSMCMRQPCMQDMA